MANHLSIHLNLFFFATHFFFIFAFKNFTFVRRFHHVSSFFIGSAFFSIQHKWKQWKIAYCVADRLNEAKNAEKHFTIYTLYFITLLKCFSSFFCVRFLLWSFNKASSATNNNSQTWKKERIRFVQTIQVHISPCNKCSSK